jgi:hypothetical protein
MRVNDALVFLFETKPSYTLLVSSAPTVVMVSWVDMK